MSACRIAVCNVGASSLKVAVLTVSGSEVVEESRAERAWAGEDTIGEDLEQVFAPLTGAIDAIGHRVVHGGDRFRLPVRLDADAEAGIERLIPLAPLHNARALAVIQAARRIGPRCPAYAVFDTAFHAGRADESMTYALPAAMVDRFGFRRYGFHGIAHQSLVESLARAMGRPVSEVSAVTLQLGAGCSACAVQAGRSIETSMGYTPLDGLVMGTRSGSVDPAIVLTLVRDGHAADEIEQLLTRSSGLLALAGTADMRELLADAAAADSSAELALRLFVRRIVMTVGAYFTLLNGEGALVFGGGIGTNSPQVRSRVAAGLSALGIALDQRRNDANRPGIISTAQSRCVYVARTDEEAVIAREVSAALSGA